MATITEWMREAYENAKAHGFHDQHDNTRERIAVFMVNLHGEVSEFWESFRAGSLYDPCDKAEKMQAMGLRPLTCGEEELADIAIRTFDTAAALGIDLDAAIEAKHAYNKTRPHKHGGKLA